MTITEWQEETIRIFLHLIGNRLTTEEKDFYKNALSTAFRQATIKAFQEKENRGYS